MRASLVFYCSLIFMIALPCAAFFGGYRLTEEYFKQKMIPFPFEHFGVAAGLGCFFWALGFLILVRTIYQQWRKPS